MTVTQLLEEQAVILGDRPFIFCQDDQISYAGMRDRAARVAANLAARGVTSGDTILVVLGNCIEFLDLFLGAGRIGAVVVPVNPMLKADELAYIAGHSEAETIVFPSGGSEAIADACAKAPHLKRAYVVGAETATVPGSRPFDELLAPVEDPIPPIVTQPDDVAAIVYTSATDGYPKGSMLTHANYIWNARMVNRSTVTDHTDRYLLVLPLFHVNSQVISVLAPLMVGADVVLMKRFNPFGILPLIQKHRVTIMSGVPTIFNVMCRMPGAETFDIGSIRFFVTGAAPLPETTYRDVQRVLKKPLVMGYGLTEATCASAAADYRDPIKWDSTGSALRFTSIRIVDETGCDVPVGASGEILISGPTVMKGYYNDPEATQAALHDGWLRTGDIGRFDTDGYLYVVGRLKDMLIRGGQNVYPRQVERYLAAIEGVADCTVVGLPDPRWGDEILAVIVPESGVTLEENAILQYCRDHLAAYKCPRFVRFLDALPRTPTGAVRKAELSAQFAHIIPE